ncbi:Crp/Fnr family transcriptional regulator [Belnapia sp. F-4-1]|uniref:Crp/Fnr family transcriptional regulator n=1 Tax=Belnapia sp. F-4-1 TaxID=1545443 RepID=UPI0005BE5573|nr:Crp/Fnr family transcriptional regulator [Belnapia sp. F-4-1]
MALSLVPASSSRNRLLTALPPDDLAELLPQLQPVELELRQVLHEPGKPIGSVYFVETGWVSMVAYMEDGDAAEVGLVGCEGMVGLPILLGGDRDDLEAMVQASGTALRMDAAAFRQELEHIPAFRTLLLRYALLHHGQVVRTAACNGRHHIEQRLARWLLMAHDRAEGDRFPLTHEFLSMMLGVRRAGVTVAAGALQKAGLIRYGGGTMMVTDRKRWNEALLPCRSLA